MPLPFVESRSIAPGANVRLRKSERIQPLVTMRKWFPTFRLVAESELACKLRQHAGVCRDLDTQPMQIQPFKAPTHQIDAQVPLVRQLVVEEHKMALGISLGHNIPDTNNTYNSAIAPYPPQGAIPSSHRVIQLGDVGCCDGAAVRVFPEMVWKPRAMGIARLHNLVDGVGGGGREEFGAQRHDGT